MTTQDQARLDLQAWRQGVASNFFEADPHLQSLLRLHGGDDLFDDLHRFGDVCAELDPLIRRNNRDDHLPRLRRYDDIGRRVEQVEFTGDYHTIGRRLYASGAMSALAAPGGDLRTGALTYLGGQNGESGHLCPFACTAGLIKILQASGTAPGEWLERLTDPCYDTHFHGAQFLTEIQGGSDVGANGVVATPTGDGAYRLTGEKWFCSVADAHLFLVTARPSDAPAGTRGLQAFAVPRHHEGAVNGFAIRRLKYKLGTRSMASGEIDFEGAWGWPVGDFRATVGLVLNTSRVFNALVSCGILQRCWREAEGYSRHRKAFGQPIGTFPAVVRKVADLRVTAYAARGLTFHLVKLSETVTTGQASEDTAAAWRMLVNLNKFWTSLQGTSACRMAIEVLGGNGAIEEFSVLPRLLRDSVVCEQWEGPHDVLCAQVLRDSQRIGMHRAMFDHLEGIAGPHPRLTAARARYETVLERSPQEAAGLFRDVALELQPVAQALPLLAEARQPGADPLLGVVAEHLLTTTERGYDPLADTTLATRVATLGAR